jgi:glycerophosphoryl diester phosphodiesterase
VAPENTMAAFQLARDQSADGVELDVQPSLDGELVVIHDVTLDRTTSGSGNVFQTRWDELRHLDAGSWFSELHSGEPIPRLADVVALEGLRLEIELKGYGLAFLDDVLQCVLAADALHRVEFTSFNVPLLLHLKQREPKAQIGLFTHRQQPWMDDAAFEHSIVGLASTSSFDVTHVYARDITPSIVTRLHDLGILAHANDAETRHDVQRIIDVGADRLTIKDPSIAQALLA